MYQSEERKTAQIVAYLLNKTEARQLNRIKLLILMYLATREHYTRHCLPINEDRLFALESGPVLFETAGLVFRVLQASEYWNGLISIIGKDVVGLIRETTEDDQDKLSPVIKETLDHIFQNFGRSNTGNFLAPYVRTLPEWQDRWDGRAHDWNVAHISPRDIMEALGTPPDKIDAFVHYMEDGQELTASREEEAGHKEDAGLDEPLEQTEPEGPTAGSDPVSTGRSYRVYEGILKTSPSPRETLVALICGSALWEERARRQEPKSSASDGMEPVEQGATPFLLRPTEDARTTFREAIQNAARDYPTSAPEPCLSAKKQQVKQWAETVLNLTIHPSVIEALPPWEGLRKERDVNILLNEILSAYRHPGGAVAGYHEWTGAVTVLGNEESDRMSTTEDAIVAEAEKYCDDEPEPPLTNVQKSFRSWIQRHVGHTIHPRIITAVPDPMMDMPLLEAMEAVLAAYREANATEPYKRADDIPKGKVPRYLLDDESWMRTGQPTDRAGCIIRATRRILANCWAIRDEYYLQKKDLLYEKGSPYYKILHILASTDWRDSDKLRLRELSDDPFVDKAIKNEISYTVEIIREAIETDSALRDAGHADHPVDGDHGRSDGNERDQP